MSTVPAVAERPRFPGADRWGDAAAVALIVLLGWLVGASVAAIGGSVAWALALGAAAVAVLLGWNRPVLLAFALLPVTLLTATGLVPDAGRYHATAVVAAPLAALGAWAVVRGRVHVVRPSVTLTTVLVAYVAWCAVTTLASTARLSSAVYLAGIIVTLALVYAAPAFLSDRAAARGVLVVVAALGLGCAAIGLMLAAGPMVLFGRPVGQYEILELTLLGNPTGVVFLRSIGPFLASNGQGINIALALIALAALRAGTSGRARALLAVGVAAVLVALLDSLSRNGWLLAALGLAIVALPDLRRRRPSLAVASTAIITLALVLLLGNLVGADRRTDLMTARYGAAGPTVSADLSAPPPAAPSASPRSPTPSPAPSRSPASTTSPNKTPVPAAHEAARGGSSLTGRLELWGASITAIRQRPILGWGLGQDIEAIAPWVPPALTGLTSHSTWLRSAVETGIPGLVALLAWVAVSGALIVRRLRGDPGALDDPIRLAFVGSFVGLTAAATFDTFLLGGVTFMNIYWALSAVLAAGVLARPVNPAQVP